MEFDPRDRAVYLPATGTLVCADLHVGRDAASDVEFRVGEHDDLTGRFERLLERYDPERAVIAGDLLHSFDRVPTGAAATVRTIADLAAERDCPIAVTPGNHDTMLEELWDGPTVPEYAVADGSIVVTHTR